MNTFSDRMSSFAQEVLTRFADELPEETFHQVSDIVLRELQYQQIQEKIYVPLKEFLDALQKNSETNNKIIKRIDAMLAGNVQQLQRDEKQMGLLRDLKKEQDSFADNVQQLSEEVGTTLQEQVIANIKDECTEIVHKISQKMENNTVQYNKDNANISNQISMLIEIHKQFMDEFKNSDVTSAIEKATSKLEDLQKESITKVSAQLDSIPELIQSEIMEAIDSQEILDSLKEQQNFISNKIDERMEKVDVAPSLEESQLLLQPIQDAVLDQQGQLETMLSSIQDSIAELQIQGAEVAEATEIAEEPTSVASGVATEDLEEKMKALIEPLMNKLDDSALENIRPKDLDTMKKSLAKMMETGFWRIEQLVENNSVTSEEKPKSAGEDNINALKGQLQKIEDLLREKLENSTSAPENEDVSKQLRECTAEIVDHVTGNIKEHFPQAALENKLATIEEKIDKLGNEQINTVQQKLDDLTELVADSQSYYEKLQDAIANVENKVLGLALEMDMKKNQE